MPEVTPNVSAPLWDQAQASPWLVHNKGFRIFDAFAAMAIISDRDLDTPPSTPDDGERFLVKATGQGAWLGHDGELAIAVGSNASNGWYFANVEVEGMRLMVLDEGIMIQWLNGSWGLDAGSTQRLQDLLDVDTTGLADGSVMKWDASNGVFYFAHDLTGGGGSSGATRLQDLTDISLTGIADGYTLKYDASNGLFYFAPDIAGIKTPLEITGTSYDLLNSHLDLYLRFTSLAAKTVNVRAQATHALTAGGEWHIRNAGIENITLVPATGVSITPPAGGSLIIEPGGTVTLKNIAADVFDLIGQTLVLVSG